MREALSKVERLTAEVQHLALDLYALNPTHITRHSDELRRLRAELADTLSTKMLAIGPMRNMQGAYFLALGERLFQYVFTAPARSEVYDMASPGLESWGWLCALALAEPCTKDEFHKASATAARIMSGRTLARAVVPTTARPTAVGGARFITDVWVNRDMLPAFHEALGEMGGFVESERQAVFDGQPDLSITYFTISVQQVNDLFSIGKMMALIHCAEKAGGTAA